jgi:dihydroxy-acid dehydratase
MKNSVKLRSNFERGTYRWAVRRAQWRALGLTDEDMEKPKIAIVNTSSELSICFSHLDGVSTKVKEAIRGAGGIPFEVRTAAPSDFIHSAGHRGGYILSSRDLITNDIEVQVEGAMLDGMVVLASCDKTTPGQLMAAGRLNIPSIAVICGYQPAGKYKGKHVDIEDVFLASAHVQFGDTTVDDLEGMSEQAIRGPGVCQGIGTANSMHIVCEALGMALPGSAPIRANSAKMFEYAKESGERIVQMVLDDLKPRDVMTPDSFANASMAVLSLGGSINCVKHLQAIANESEVKVDIYKLFEDYAGQIPLLAAIAPNGPNHIETLEDAGGARAVMKRLEKFIKPAARSVSGQTVGEILKATPVEKSDVLLTVDNPVSKKPSIVIVRGSLAPEAGIVKLGVSESKKLQHVGKAIIYESTKAALDGLQSGEIKAGHVVVLRGLGVKGGPGMGMASMVAFGLDGVGLSEQVPLVTDGQLSGLMNKGLVVGEISPEAAEGGPLALVENGDQISIDVDKRVVNLDVPESMLEERRKNLKLFQSPHERGWLSIYQRTVKPLRTGGVLLK